MPGAPDQTALAALGEDGRAEALRRWEVLRAHLEDGVPLARVAAQSGIPHRTVQRWLARYRAGGLAGLGRAPRADRGRSRFPEPLRLLIEGLALRTPAPSAAHVHRQVTAVAEREGWPVPSYSSVYAIIRGIGLAMATLAHEGSKRYKEVFDLVHTVSVDGTGWLAGRGVLLLEADNRLADEPQLLTTSTRSYSTAPGGIGSSPGKLCVLAPVFRYCQKMCDAFASASTAIT